MYFITMDAASGRLTELSMTPTQTRRFRVNRASRKDALWIRDTLNREGKKFGTQVEFDQDFHLVLSWDKSYSHRTTA
ncbi:MAG: hypothetical protein C4530_24685 [Desulfobacteraceae bacterium]|nr:MAG: hypothetical protein C4530_24685 [Desulfobacteraceae bacterium]